MQRTSDSTSTTPINQINQTSPAASAPWFKQCFELARQDCNNCERQELFTRAVAIQKLFKEAVTWAIHDDASNLEAHLRRYAKEVQPVMRALHNSCAPDLHDLINTLGYVPPGSAIRDVVANLAMRSLQRSKSKYVVWELSDRSRSHPPLYLVGVTPSLAGGGTSGGLQIPNESQLHKCKRFYIGIDRQGVAQQLSQFPVAIWPYTMCGMKTTGPTEKCEPKQSGQEWIALETVEETKKEMGTIASLLSKRRADLASLALVPPEFYALNLYSILRVAYRLFTTPCSIEALGNSPLKQKLKEHAISKFDRCIARVIKELDRPTCVYVDLNNIGLWMNRLQEAGLSHDQITTCASTKREVDSNSPFSTWSQLLDQIDTASRRPSPIVAVTDTQPCA